MISQAEELRHLRRRAITRRDFSPVLNEFRRSLGSNMPQTWANLSVLARVRCRVRSSQSAGLLSLRFQTHVRPNRSLAIKSMNLMTPVATVLLNQLPAPVSLGSSRSKLRMYTQFRHVVMALDAGRLDKSSRLHRVLPKVVRVEPILMMPVLGNVRVVRSVFGIRKAGAGTLSVVTDRAPESADRVRAGC